MEREPSAAQGRSTNLLKLSRLLTPLALGMLSPAAFLPHCSSKDVSTGRNYAPSRTRNCEPPFSLLRESQRSPAREPAPIHLGPPNSASDLWRSRMLFEGVGRLESEGVGKELLGNRGREGKGVEPISNKTRDIIH